MLKYKYVVFWERIANSGYILVDADTALSAIDKTRLNPDYCKLSAFRLDVSGESVTVGKGN